MRTFFLSSYIRIIPVIGNLSYTLVPFAACSVWTSREISLSVSASSRFFSVGWTRRLWGTPWRHDDTLSPRKIHHCEGTSPATANPTTILLLPEFDELCAQNEKFSRRQTWLHSFHATVNFLFKRIANILREFVIERFTPFAFICAVNIVA